MSDLNNNQNVENGVENQNQKKEILLNKFITDFSNSYFSGDEKNSRLNSLFKTNELTTDLKRHLELFLSLKSDEFSSSIKPSDLEKIKINDFRKKTLSIFLDLENSKQNLKDKILSDYDIPQNLLNLLDNKLIILKDSDIIKLLEKDSNRNAFVKKIFPNVVKKQDAIKNFFLKFDILSGYSDFSLEKKNAIMKIFNNDGTLRKIDIYILEELFEAGIFNLEQKKEILSYFIPSISLSQIRKLKLFGDLTDKVISEFKESIIKSFVNENGLKNLDLEEEVLISLLNEDKLKISTNNLIQNSSFNNLKIDEIIENYDLHDFVDSYNNFLEDVSLNESRNDYGDGFEGFKNKLSELDNVSGVEKFKDGNYIILDLYLEADEKQDKDITKQFFKINKLEDGNYNLSLVDCGFGSVNFLANDAKSIPYKNFINIISKGFKKGNDKFLIKKCSFSTKTSIDDSVNKGLIEEYIPEGLTKYELDDELKLNLLKEKEKELKAKFDIESSSLPEIKEIDERIEILTFELKNSNPYEERKQELLSLIEVEKSKKINFLEELINTDLNELPENLREIKNDLIECNSEITSLEDIFSFDKLLLNIDEFDVEGKKYGFKEGLSFTSDKGIYTIEKIDLNNCLIDVKGIGGISKDIGFKEFFQEFKRIKSKRLSSNNSATDLILNICGDTSLDSGVIDNWNDYEIKNNSIHKKGSTKNIEYDYLKAKESDDLINIESISGNTAVISFGEYDEYDRDANGNVKKDKDGNKIKKQSITMYTGSSVQVSISWLESWIKKNEARPSSIEESKDVEKTDIKGENIKGSFLSRYMNRLSVFDILSGMKLGLNSIESYLKEGSEEKSAKAAQGILGKFLPESLRNDLMSRVEESQKKRSDDYISKLGNVDSWKATRMIIDWLKNKDAPQYLKEAGALFMLQKYGVLYAKDLYPYKGKFLFYESFGGKIGDELYEEVKAEAKRTNQNFTEEQLLFILVKKQCGEKGYKGIRRRSRYHKEFKKHRNVGKQDEYETGKGDAKDERTVGARINGAMGELYGGTYPNARGWLEESVNKGGSMEDMNKVPFIMAFSGVAYNFEQNELDQLKNFPARSMMLPVLRFLSLNKDIDLMNQTILEVCKRYGEIKGGDIYTDALKIFGNQKSNSISEANKIRKTEEFYKKYGKVITDILYMLNTGESGDKNKDSYLSKMILIEKDDRVDDDGNTISGNNTFKRYFDLLQAYTGEFNYGSDDLYGDAFSGKGTSGINIHKATKELLQQVQGGTYRLANAGPAMWDELRKEIDAIRERDYGVYGRAGQEIDMKNMIRGFIGGLLEAHGTNSMALRSLVSSNSSTIYSKSKEWGIDLTKIMRYSYSDVVNLKAEGLVNEYVDILLNGISSSQSNSTFEETIFGVKDRINQI